MNTLSILDDESESPPSSVDEDRHSIVGSNVFLARRRLREDSESFTDIHFSELRVTTCSMRVVGGSRQLIQLHINERRSPSSDLLPHLQGTRASAPAVLDSDTAGHDGDNEIISVRPSPQQR